MSPRLARRLATHLAPLVGAVALVAAPSVHAATDRCDPSKGIVYAPAQGTNGTVLFEDRWPANADLDFNDAVVDYNYEFLLDSISDVATLKASFTVLAVGASLHSGMYLHLPVAAALHPVTITDQNDNPVTPVAGESDIVVPISSDTHDLFGIPTATYINTRPGDAVQTPRTITLTITFDQGVALDTSGIPFDLFIALASDYSHQIHLPQYAGTTLMNTALFETGDDDSHGAHAGLHFINHDGLPFALAVPDPIAWPAEMVSIDNVYPEITLFGTSNGTQNTGWYTDEDSTDAYAGHTGGAAAPLAPITPDITCVVPYSDPTGHCVIFADQLISTGGNLDACSRSPSPEYQEGWLNYDEMYCTVTHVCNVEYATWVYWHYGDNAGLPAFPHGTGSACDPAVPSRGCCENIPNIDQACQVDGNGDCITVPTPNGYTQCAGPQQ